MFRSFQSSSMNEQVYCPFEPKNMYLLQNLHNPETILNIQTNKPKLTTIQKNFSDEWLMGEPLQMQENEENTVSSTEYTYGSDDLQDMECKSTLVDLLLKGAGAVEASDWAVASSIISKISSILLNIKGEYTTFSDIVFYLTQGLHYKCQNAPQSHLFHELVPTQKEPMSAFQMLQELSPYLKISQFIANQAILEATQGEDEVHVIDLDIMEGIQWPPLMADLAQRKEVSFRITAIVLDPQNADTIQQTGRRLTEFAESINLTFRFDKMILREEDDFNSIDVNQAVIANCMVHQLHMNSRNFSFVGTFLKGVRKLSIKMVTLVEEELFNFAKVSSLSLVEFFSEAIQHYTAFSDSLAHNSTSAGFRLFAKDILGLRVLDCVKNFPINQEEKLLWYHRFSSLQDFKPVPISAHNISQAKLLVSLYGRSYWVGHENCRLSLYWETRPLVTATIWSPNRG
ncbi:hypothetical protein SLE2022_329790 [Rubroshorea leprosula]